MTNIMTTFGGFCIVSNKVFKCLVRHTTCHIHPKLIKQITLFNSIDKKPAEYAAILVAMFVLVTASSPLYAIDSISKLRSIL